MNSMNNAAAKQKVKEYLKAQKEVLLLGPMNTDAYLLESFTIENPEIPIIAIDGGSKHLRTPHLSIGDGDSKKQSCSIPFETKKDFTDLEGTLKLLPSELEHIHTMGFSGGRLDHQLVVVGNLFHQVRTYNCKVSLLDAKPMFIFPRGQNTISIKGNFSILSLFHTIISIEGECAYQVQNIELPPFSGHGLSNIGSGDLEIKSNQPIGIYLFSDVGDN
jgi:thiamine pyrophosphokinase